MINKELIELQKGCKATCVVVLEESYKELGEMYIINALEDSNELFRNLLGNPYCKEDIDNISNNAEIAYFVINGIEEVNEDMQKNYSDIVKDRLIGRYELPSNIIIVFTVKDREGIKKISKELYHFCVVVF